MMSSARFKRFINYSIILAALVLPVFLLLLPADFFDQGQSVCLSVLIFDTTCYGCGITRAIMHLLHADFSAAWEFNKMSFLVLPALIYGWFDVIKTARAKIKETDKQNSSM